MPLGDLHTPTAQSVMLTASSPTVIQASWPIRLHCCSTAACHTALTSGSHLRRESGIV